MKESLYCVDPFSLFYTTQAFNSVHNGGRPLPRPLRNESLGLDQDISLCFLRYFIVEMYALYVVTTRLPSPEG